MTPFEMAKELFQNPKLSPASIEVKVITNLVRTLPQSLIYGEDVPDTDYRPPKQISHGVARIKKYVSSAKSWNERKLTPTQKKCVEALIHYLHDFRFKRQIDSYEKTEDKITFENEFIKYCHDKPDLTQEEVSQYISLCSFIVMEFNIKLDIEMLQSTIARTYDEEAKVSHGLVEALESSRVDLDNCVKRQQSLYSTLTEKRSQKLSKEMKDKESLLTFFKTWQNEEDLWLGPEPELELRETKTPLVLRSFGDNNNFWPPF